MRLEPFQKPGWRALGGPARHVLLYGGARSGKTYLILLWILLRGLLEKSTHAVARFRFNHLRASIIEGTLPIVARDHWPGQKIYSVNRTEWYAELVNGSRLYFLGLDDKERVEKVLGQEHSTFFLNEISQISYGAYLTSLTRLSQNSGLGLKCICDCNPPKKGHWAHKLWIEGREPRSGQPAQRARYAAVRMNPVANPHLPEETKEELAALPPRERARFWLGEFGAAEAGALWSAESIERARVAAVPEPLTHVVVAVDPSGCGGPEDTRSDEVGVVVVGLGESKTVYVLEDASGRYGPGGEHGWGALLVGLFRRHKADRVVAEINFGGAMVQAVLRSATGGLGVPFHEVHASRGKAVRAEPVATLTDAGRVRFVGTGFPELEEQLTAMTTGGYTGPRSPDRADAFVWGCYDLGVVDMPSQGLADWLQAESRSVASRSVPAGVDARVELVVPAGISGTYYARSGAPYVIESGRVHVLPVDVPDMLSRGFARIC